MALSELYPKILTTLVII